MKEPTKADLTAAVAKLTQENAGMRDLLAATRAYADLPHPANYDTPGYAYECERRLDAIAVWANGDQEDMAPDVYPLVIGDRAKHLREEAARPVRYEVKGTAPVSAEAKPRLCAKGGHMVGVYCKLPPHSEGGHLGTGPDGDVTWPQEPRPANPPHHMTGNMVGASCCAEDGGYICNAQENHDGPDHVAYDSAGQQCHRWPVAPEAEPLVISDSTIAQAEALAGDIEAGTWPAPAPSGMQSPAPVVRVIGHPFDAGEGSREISGPGRELLAAAIAEQDAADEAATAGPYARERDEGDADLAAMSGYCPAMTGPDEGLDVTLYCDRQAGHAGSHHAPCRNGGGVAWSDEAALCDSAMPLPNGGELKCTFDGGHYGAHSAHSALGGKRRWVGHGADARTEDGELIATVTA